MQTNRGLTAEQSTMGTESSVVSIQLVPLYSTTAVVFITQTKQFTSIYHGDNGQILFPISLLIHFGVRLLRLADNPSSSIVKQTTEALSGIKMDAGKTCLGYI